MKKTKINLMVLCDEVIRAVDNKASIIGMFDQLNFKSLPGQTSRNFLFAVITGQPNTIHKATVKVTDPNGNRLGGVNDVDLNIGKNGKNNFSLDMTGMPIEKEGLHKISLSVDGLVTEEISLTVAILKNSDDREGDLSSTNKKGK